MKLKRLLLLLIITVFAVFFAFSFSKKGSAIESGPNNTEAEVINAEVVKNNIKLYQPQKTDKTIEQDIGVNAQSAIVFDQGTGEIIYQKNQNTQLAPASITKIATFSVALENLKLDNTIEISQKAADQEPNKIVMKAGEKLKLDDLLYGLMMISANDAAFAIAEAMPGGYDAFIGKMNEKVRSLGLSNTNFENPSGLDGEKHFSSAFDIATLTRYALKEHPEIITYAGKKDDHSVYPTEHNESHWWSHISSTLYRYPGMLATKTGYTDIANSTFVGIAERSGRKLVVVFLNSKDANGDVTKLLDYGFAH